MLAGILAPSRADAGPEVDHWPAEDEARAMVARLLATGRATISNEKIAKDRYGRRVGSVIIVRTDGAPPLWVEKAMIEAGAARVAPRPGERACYALLLEAERVARQLGIGLWANPAYAVRDAGETRALFARSGRLQLIEGVVRRVTRRRTHVFIDFGGDWKRDTTSVIARKLLKDGSGVERDLGPLEGRRIRVRGWVERRYGPSVDLAAYEAIEILDGEVEK
ncbi:MAG: thermonuclease family protein [Hyphomicrobium sp.]|nr:thermonuclease family protein [Hyphomicrobium sp.]